MNVNCIYNEDCIKTMARMPDGFVDLVITSPPYDDIRSYEGNEFIDLEKISKSLYRVMKEGGVIVWVVDDRVSNFSESGTSFKQALYFKEKAGFNLFDTMIWQKQTRGGVGSIYTYIQCFEYMFVFSKGKPKTINHIKDRENKSSRVWKAPLVRDRDGKRMKRKQPLVVPKKFGRRTNIWKINVGGGINSSNKLAHQHPAIFPERLVRDHILSWSNPKDLVYDPFMGSGTVAFVSRFLRRNYIGSEIVSKYCKIIEERMSGKFPSGSFLE